jgi:hypothetical protein
MGTKRRAAVNVKGVDGRERKVPVNETIPVKMVAYLEQLGQALIKMASEQRDGKLVDLELGVLAIVREWMPRLLEEVIGVSQTSLLPDFAQLKESCPGCGQLARGHEWRPRTIKTVCGPIVFERRWYICPHCGHGFSPTDKTLDLSPRERLSAGLAEWVIVSGTRMSFAEAAGEIGELTGLKVSAETVRQYTEGRGLELEAVDHERQAEVARTQEAAEPVDRAPGQMITEMDGVMVRFLGGWHEVKLGLIAGQVDGKLKAPSYVAMRGTAEEFGKRLLAEAARRGALEIESWEGPVTGRGLAVLREVVVVGDGAVWIWNLAASEFGERIEIVDFYHASEHLWEVAKALYGEGTTPAQAWATQRLTELRHEGVLPVLRALAGAKPTAAEAQDVLRREKGYFRTNASRMAYPQFEAMGLPIGSGAVESSAKHVVQQRMKLAGARWSDEGGQAVLNLRCRLASGRSLAA